MQHEHTPLAEPFQRFQEWMEEAARSEPNDPNAMVVATVSPDGQPSARMVLLKAFDQDGFVFYTNKQSRKAEELFGNARVALLFHWKTLQRQVRIEGQVRHATDAEADAYYASRARISRLGAWASDQSRALADREVLLQRLAEVEARYPEDPIPRPPHWSGYRVVPAYFEFWQDMPFRLHDRSTFTRAEAGGWTTGKLFP